MRMLRFRCLDCHLEMIVEVKPEKCFECGSSRLAREGWKSRFRQVVDETTQEECGAE